MLFEQDIKIQKKMKKVKYPCKLARGHPEYAIFKDDFDTVCDFLAKFLLIGVKFSDSGHR